MVLNRFKRFFGAVLSIILVACAFPVTATHIVGGELTYRCIGRTGANTVTYEIQLTIYQDCIGGERQAISEDTPAFIGIYDIGTAGSVIVDKNVRPSSSLLVPPNFNNNCVNNPPATCLNRITFIKRYTLPINNAGYRVVYQRCCRNASVINIVDPSNAGATYFCSIPPYEDGLCNNSAQFTNFPPQIICINNPLIYDHSATDADSDSLSYEFCESYSGGAPNNPKPDPPFVLPGLPPTLIYQGFYSPASPMGGSPPIKINPQTGIISGTPNIMGRYVVTVCCHEWRNGQIINTVKREFQFVVTNCSKAVVANIPQFSDEFNTYIVNCESLGVKYINHSSGGFEYYWDFGDGNTSAAFEPEHTYADTGTYTVKLVVNRGSTCPDSISRLVKLYPIHVAKFGREGLLCPKTPISFFDSTVTTYGPVNKWFWTFGDGQSSGDQDPAHMYQSGGLYNVQLIAGNIKGCLDTAVQAIEVENFIPFAGNDTIIVKGEIINFRATGGFHYVWTPATNLSTDVINNPTGFYPDTGRFGYSVHITSLVGCEGDDSINVWVVSQGSLFVPNAFTPNGDGVNDFLKPFAVGYAKVNFFGVFNRWGERVFTSEDFSKGWDGRYKDKLAPMDTYNWLLKVTDKDGNQETRKGDVILIR